MKKLLVGIALSLALEAQSVSITNPGAGTPTLTGFSGNSFSVSLASLPSVARVCYMVDGYPAYNPGLGPLHTVGCTAIAPYSYAWNTNWVFPGTHTVSATAYDGLGNLLATSSLVPFIVSNTYPLSCGGSSPSWTVTTGTPVTSPWSGFSTITYQPTDSCATDNNAYAVYIDGVQQQSFISTLAGTKTSSLDTTQFANGSHIVAVTRYDTSKQVNYANGSATGGNEWSAVVSFANGAVPMEVHANAHEVFVQPTQTFSLGCILVNTDLTVAASPTCDYYSQNTSIATVNSSGVVTGVATGNAKVRVMAEQFTGTDLVISAGLLNRVSSATHSFGTGSIGRVLNIKSGTNWIPGFYEITAVNAGVATLSVNAATSTTATNGNFATGPSRTEWAFVGAPAYIPHFSGSGRRLTAFDPANSFFMHEMFGSAAAFTDQAYPPGIGADINRSGFNTIETGAVYQDASTITGSQTAYQTAENNYVAGSEALTAPWPRLHWYVTGDGFVRSTAGMYATTRGTPSSYSPSALAYSIQQWTLTGNTIAYDMMDEGVPAYKGPPLQGPITFGVTTQSWLNSITSNGTTCTASAPGWSIDGSTSNGAPFNISGATTTGLNATPGVTQYATFVSSSAFTFPCTAASGTYNASTDPALQLNPLNMNFWSASNDFIHFDGLAYLRAQADTVVNRPGFTMSFQAGAATNCPALQAWNNNILGQSLLGVSQFGDYSDLYISDVADYYLMSRLQSQGVTDAGGNFQSIGNLRGVFGCYSPTNPLVVQVSGTSDNYGLQGYPVAVTSLTGNLMTFAAPHGITKVIPGATRLSLSGSSNAAQNTNYYVVDWPTPTTAHVVLATPNTITDATCGSGTGGSNGTITFQNGDTLALSSAAGSIVTCTGGAMGNHMSSFTYAGSPADNVNRHRGQTFTLSGVTGTGAAYFNSTTFYFSAENVLFAQDPNGTAVSTANFFREVPTLSGTGGTAAITLDNTLVKGRGASSSLFAGSPRHPSMTFAMMIEAAIIRAAATRAYKLGNTVNGYQDQKFGGTKQGWMGIQSLSLVGLFNDTDISNQLYMHPYFENGAAVPMFHAGSIGAMLINRNMPLLFQASLNSPDYGELIDCAARGGSNGKILLCGNFSDGPQTRTFTFSPYTQSGQPFVCQVWNWFGAVSQTTFAPGTASHSYTLQPDDALICEFPTTFSGFLRQPAINVKLSDVRNAAKVAVRWSYDWYFLDAPANNVFDCGTGACTLPVDQNVGTVYYRIIFLNSAGAVLATSDVQKL